MWFSFFKKDKEIEEHAEKLNILFKHTCHYERIGVYYKEIESATVNLVFIYVIEILKCHFCGNMVENVLTKSVYKVDEERDDLINYVNSLKKHKIPSELEYKLENEGKYLHGQYNSIGWIKNYLVRDNRC